MQVRIAFILIVCLSLGSHLQAQREETLLGDLDLTGAWGGFTYNYSDYGDDWALVRGGFGGLELGNRFFLGYGGWSIRDDVRLSESDQVFDLRHGGFVLSYTPDSYRAIHPRATVIFGPGRVTVDGERDRIFIIQPMAGLELNVFEAFRLGVEGGYRLAGNVELENSDISSQDASTFFVQIEMRFGFSW